MAILVIVITGTINVQPHNEYNILVYRGITAIAHIFYITPHALLAIYN